MNRPAAAAFGHVGGRPAYALTIRDAHAFELRAVPDGGPLGSSTRQEAPIRALALGETGLLAEGSDNHLIRLWDAATGQALGVRTGHGNAPVQAVCADGTIAYSAGADGTVHAWGLLGAEDLGSVSGSAGGLTSVACARVAGRALVAAGGDDGVVRVWDARDGVLLHALTGHVASVNALAMLGLGDQGLVASGGADGTLRIWELAAGSQLHAISGSAGVTGVALAMLSRRPVAAWCAADATIRTADALSCEPLGTAMMETAPTGIAVVGEVLAASGTDGALRLWHAVTGAGPRVIGGPGVPASAITLASGRLAAGYADGAVRCWDIASGSPESELPATDGPVTSVAFGAAGVLVCGTATGTVRIHDGTTVRVPTPHTGLVTALAIGGELLASASDDGTLRTWRLPAGDPLLRITGQDVTALALSAADVLAVGFADGTIYLLDAHSGQATATLSAGGPVAALWLGDDALVAGRCDGAVITWRPPAGGVPEEVNVQCRPLAVTRSEEATVVAHASGLITVRPEELSTLAEVVGRQLGMITSRQAARLGITDLSALVELDWSVYQTADSPLPPRYAYPYAAWLALAPDRFAWERPVRDAVVSHESAAELHGIGRLTAPLTTFTTPEALEAPLRMRIVTASLAEGDVMRREGVPVTTPLRTIRDLRDVTDAEDYGALVADALSKGLVERQELP